VQERRIAATRRMHDHSRNTLHSYAQCCLGGCSHGVLYQQSFGCFMQWRDGNHTILHGQLEWRHICTYSGPDRNRRWAGNLERIMYTDRRKQGYLDRAYDDDNRPDMYG
jgi:hypothetical protein